MSDTKITPDVSILEAFKSWINQQPGLDRRDYGDIHERGSFRAYMQDLRSIQRDGTRARKALKEARAYPFNGEAMKDALNRAFSGRLSWNGTELEYVTGQYWPTEYRIAAATVLELYCHAVRPKFTPAPDAQFFTISDIREASIRAGSHWFDRSTLRFFRSRMLPEVYNGPGGIFFISSEQYSDETARLYTVRQFHPKDADITTVGDFNKLSKYQARKLAAECAKSGPPQKAAV